MAVASSRSMLDELRLEATATLMLLLQLSP